jgi:hypothetical protein
MVIQDVGSSLVIALELSGCMINFKHQLQTAEDSIDDYRFSYLI